MKHSKKKKRSRPPNQVGVKGANHGEESEEQRALKSLMEAFNSVSIEVVASAYREANGDLNKAAEIIGDLEEITDDQATSCSSSSGTARSSLGSGSSSSEVLMEPNCGQIGVHGKGFRGNKQKKVVAATGTVSSVLGKDYVTTSIRKDSSKRKGYAHVPASKEDAVQFLYSMLGDNSELSVAVVRDVLGQCGCDIEKALNALLEFSASSCDRPKNGQACEHGANNKEDTQFLIEVSDNLTEGASDSTSHTSESEIQDNVWSMSYHHRNYSEVLSSSEVRPHLGHGNLESELPQKVLETLFNMPKNAEHEPHTMNWKDVVKKIESLGQRFEYDPADGAKPEHFHAKGDGYEVHRKAASQHWDSMKSYYQKAATAFSNGERGYAAHLSEKGRIYNKMAREADEKASQEIFKARNKSIENVITIDLHGQHVKQAIRLLKVHLLFGAYVHSVQIFRVITGCGSHGVGKSKLKQSVINLVEREGIEWSEENRGTVLIRLDGQRAFTFVESDSDDE
ncbi:SMR domain-containing protein At5g58720 isoform X1 [Actinidia eriantha]|uniref:SMR domain-containing protein At5g58720 isoform X1 n=1 Tax=Actinidia eriantha TaxID=165200 RepID=UPI0025894B37|nr:SMR domain-containing protein At5g58720 isoform X1 [Actinidia eriantha]